MSQVLFLAAVTGLASLTLRTLYIWLRRRQFMRHRGCVLPPKIPQNPLQFGADFLKVYNTARELGDAIPHMEEILLTHPGRTATVEVSGQTWLFTCNADNVKSIMTFESPAMAVEPNRKAQIDGWMGDGHVNSDGDRWQQSRNMFKAMFSRLPISNLKRFETHAARFFDRLPIDGQTIDLQPLLIELYFDSSTEIMLGESANAQIPDQANIDIAEFEHSFGQALIGAYSMIFKRNTFFKPKADKVWLEHCKNVHKVFDRYIDRAIEQKKDTQGAETETDDLSMLEHLMKYSQNKTFLRDQLMNVFLAAKDTAGIGISDVLFNLARHPRVYGKLRAEVATIGDQPLTFELLKSLKYLQAVMNESLRILSPVNISLRETLRDIVLPRGGGTDGQEPIFVAKGTRVDVSISVLHLDPSFWGPDAADFRPERWLNGFAPKWEYAPFLGGARICPAQQMMLTQYGYLLVRFAQKYSRIENRDPEEKFVAEVIFSQQSKNGVKVALHG